MFCWCWSPIPSCLHLRKIYLWIWFLTHRFCFSLPELFFWSSLIGVSLIVDRSSHWSILTGLLWRSYSLILFKVFPSKFLVEEKFISRSFSYFRFWLSFEVFFKVLIFPLVWSVYILCFEMARLLIYLFDRITYSPFVSTEGCPYSFFVSWCLYLFFFSILRSYRVRIHRNQPNFGCSCDRKHSRCFNGRFAEHPSSI